MDVECSSIIDFYDLQLFQPYHQSVKWLNHKVPTDNNHTKFFSYLVVSDTGDVEVFFQHLCYLQCYA